MHPTPEPQKEGPELYNMKTAGLLSWAPLPQLGGRGEEAGSPHLRDPAAAL